MLSKPFLRIFSFFVFVLLLVWFWFHAQGQNILEESWMDTHVRNAGYMGIVLYVALVTSLTSMGVPRQLCSLLGGYTFGMWFGTLWATLGTVFACTLCFCYARFLGQEWLHKRFGHKLTSFNNFLCQSPFLLTLVVRIVPLGSNFLTNFLAGMSQIPALSFLGGSAVGFTVQNFIFATMGSGMRMAGEEKLLLSISLYVISLSLGYWVFARYKKHQNSYLKNHTIKDKNGSMP